MRTDVVFMIFNTSNRCLPSTWKFKRIFLLDKKRKI